MQCPQCNGHMGGRFFMRCSICGFSPFLTPQRINKLPLLHGPELEELTAKLAEQGISLKIEGDEILISLAQGATEFQQAVYVGINVGLTIAGHSELPV